MTDTLDCDVLVIGGGMAGLSAGARAAELGASVVVVEKTPALGGSGTVAGGYLWTVETVSDLRRIDPCGDPELSQVVVLDFDKVVEWLRGRGLLMTGPLPVLYGRGYHIDVAGHVDACVRSIEAAGGVVVPSATVEHLLEDPPGTVTGAKVRDPSTEVEVHAPATILATGGFQGDPDLRARIVGDAARDVQVRSNPGSTGDGLRLAESVGAHVVDDNPGFYGHLVAAPGTLDEPTQFRRLSQYHSPHSILLNEHGHRYLDESTGDHHAAQETVKQPGGRALLVWDDAIHRDLVLEEYIKGSGAEDKLEIARAWGANAAMVDSVDDIAAAVEPWGFDGAAVVASIHEFNRLAATAPQRLAPPREANRRTIADGPMRMLEVQAGMTFTYGGISTDAHGRALAADGEPIAGLFIAGADMANVYRTGYAGGLAIAFTYGLRAAELAVSG